MDARHAQSLVDQFLAVYAWQFSYVNGSWWRWDVDTNTWEYVDVRPVLHQIFGIIAEDVFPGQVKIARQTQQPYMLNEILRALAFQLTGPNLPAPPKPGSRLPSSAPAL